MYVYMYFMYNTLIHNLNKTDLELPISSGAWNDKNLPFVFPQPLNSESVDAKIRIIWNYKHGITNSNMCVTVLQRKIVFVFLLSIRWRRDHLHLATHCPTRAHITEVAVYFRVDTHTVTVLPHLHRFYNHILLRHVEG